ncbi:hypothetical protein Y032_0435g1404 [Ancylostoma ceylanicum]|uniref:BPTI/Kunitz inhibitor domain-containing protein n=1 Tax=Ancylostoma ceylanicum TaxID=53326 RepID=A0A016X112_9BILA|nr:hypothetical protein Y032_0435g1404 [Ancylostoma ceylanicum]
MKFSVVILFIVAYCCAAKPDTKCLDGPHPDNTAWDCFPPIYFYRYNSNTKKCESFLYCFDKGGNIFHTYQACEYACMK